MGRCSYEKLNGLEPAFGEIRKFADIKEPKPGIFYVKSQGFLHFHEKEGDIWADMRNGKTWGKPIEIPAKITKAFLKKFMVQVRKYYENSGGR